MNYYDKKIELFKSFPPIFNTIKDKPKIPSYYIVKINTWDMETMDYVEKTITAYFNDGEFFSTDIFNYDRTDWISAYYFNNEWKE